MKKIDHLNILNDRALSDRERKALLAIVQLYILSAEPIGSRTLAKVLEKELGLSSATIRNIMADLEELDYVKQPHTSSGRMPTDKGYRFYVNSLISLEKLTKFEMNAVKSTLLGEDIQSQVREAGKALGAISKYLALAHIPAIANIKVKRVDFIPQSSNRALAIISLDSNLVRTMVIEADFTFNSEQLESICRVVNEKIAGKPLKFIKDNFADLTASYSDSNPVLMRLFVDSVDNLLRRSDNTEDRLKIAGAQNLFGYPEFEDTDKMRGIIELIENEDAILHVIDNIEIEQIGAPQVIIGSENSSALLKDYSLVLSKFYLGDAIGAIGVIGPKRMNYSKMIPLVNFVSFLLNSKNEKL